MDGSAKPANLPDDVIGVLAADVRICTVELTGSRARGQATAWSDWDFAVTTRSFDEVREALPELLRPLHPVVMQWDRLSRTWCFMLILPGAAKVDLLFGHPHQPQGPWQVNAAALPRIGDHFWDWMLWLRSKVAAGRQDVVAGELRKLHEHLLAPMGIRAPVSLDEAVTAYRSARRDWERQFGSHVSPDAENTVFPRLHLWLSGRLHQPAQRQKRHPLTGASRTGQLRN